MKDYNNSTKGYPKIRGYYKSDFFGEAEIEMPAEKNAFSDFMFLLSWSSLVIFYKYFGTGALFFLFVPLGFMALFIKNHFGKAFKLNENGTSFSVNPICVTSQNQNMPQDFYSQNGLTKLMLREGISEETFEVEVQPQYDYVDTTRFEIEGLKARIEKLEKRLKTEAGEKEESEIFPIEFLESEKLVLKKPITIRSTYCPDTETYVVDHLELNIYGEGRDDAEAVKDFKLSLVESYFDLKEDENKLSPPLQKEWELLNQVIKEK